MKLEWFIIGVETVILIVALTSIVVLRKRRSLFMKVDSFIKQYNDAEEALDAWEDARPLLVHSTCPYAKALLSEMIVAYAFLLEHGFRDDIDYLERLIALLCEPPSDYDPSQPVDGSSLFIERTYRVPKRDHKPNTV